MLRARAASPRRGRSLAIVTSLVLVSLLAGPVVATHKPSGGGGFKTGQDEMLDPVLAGATTEALITVGEMIDDYRFEAIPDGVALRTRGEGRVDVYVNHETSTVPFPYGPGLPTPAPPTEANSQNDFDNAQLSRLVLNRHTAGVLSGKLVIPSSANYQRFCSNFLAGAAQGFDREILFTNEEATDFVSRTGTAWPVSPKTEPPHEQAGVVVGYDVRTGEYRTIYGMGRLNHENSLAVPVPGEVMVVTTDDTFRSNPPESQFYAYFAEDADAVWNDQGSLWGFRADDWATYNDYYDFGLNSNLDVPGEFVRLSDTAARGTQSALEAESDAQHVFQFVRLEDVAYDPATHSLFVADTGRGSSSAGTNPFASTNGRIWKFRLDPANPRNVLGLSLLVEGEGIGFKDPNTIHQPDNVEFAFGWLWVTEDPSSNNQYNPGETGASNARVWRVNPVTGAKTVAFEINQFADGESTDVDGLPDAKLGNWEAAGLVDASAAFGPGAMLVTIQAHSLWVDRAPGPDLTSLATGDGPPDGVRDWTYKREGGQLLLVRVPVE